MATVSSLAAPRGLPSAAASAGSARQPLRAWSSDGRTQRHPVDLPLSARTGMEAEDSAEDIEDVLDDRRHEWVMLTREMTGEPGLRIE